MNLLIDIGNTRLKWAIADGGVIVIGVPLNNTDISKESLMHAWQHIDAPARVAIACVGPSRIFDLVSSVLNGLWPSTGIYRARSEDEKLGVSNAYREPEKLGIDRWLSMVAAYDKYRRPLCIVGCGTALTFDRVDASGKHLGGLISPGLRLMREALASGTENLDAVNTPYPFGLENFTAAAIYNGTLASACGLIEYMLKEEPKDLLLLLTGGDANVVADRLSRDVIVEPDLVLYGLALILQKP